jgi:hypothetical protein
MLVASTGDLLACIEDEMELDAAEASGILDVLLEVPEEEDEFAFVPAAADLPVTAQRG